jgi:hypothetical protein
MPERILVVIGRTGSAGGYRLLSIPARPLRGRDGLMVAAVGHILAIVPIWPSRPFTEEGEAITMARQPDALSLLAIM